MQPDCKVETRFLPRLTVTAFPHHTTSGSMTLGQSFFLNYELSPCLLQCLRLCSPPHFLSIHWCYPFFNVKVRHPPWSLELLPEWIWYFSLWTLFHSIFLKKYLGLICLFLFFTFWSCGVLFPQLRIELVSPGVEGWTLNYWTTREVPLCILLMLCGDLCFLQFGITWCMHAAAARTLQSCQTLCSPIDGSPPGSPVPGILQTRTLECVAISFSDVCIDIDKFTCVLNRKETGKEEGRDCISSDSAHLIV